MPNPFFSLQGPQGQTRPDNIKLTKSALKFGALSIVRTNVPPPMEYGRPGDFAVIDDKDSPGLLQDNEVPTAAGMWVKIPKNFSAAPAGNIVVGRVAPLTAPGNTFLLNGTLVTLTGTSATTAAADINGAVIPNVVAVAVGEALLVRQVGGGDLTFVDQSGTPVVDLGLYDQTNLEATNANGVWVPLRLTDTLAVGANLSFVTVNPEGSLTNERVLTAGDATTITDGGANGPITIDHDITGTAVLSDPNVAAGDEVLIYNISTGAIEKVTVTQLLAASGALNQLVDDDSDTLIEVERGGSGADPDTIFMSVGDDFGLYDGSDIVVLAATQTTIGSSDAIGANLQAPPIQLIPGLSTGAANGGGIDLIAGAAGPTGIAGGTVSVNGGQSNSTLPNNTGGQVIITAGQNFSTAAFAAGGRLLMSAGSGLGPNGIGGQAEIQGGFGFGTGNGGNIRLDAGLAVATGDGGSISIAAGASGASGAGGQVRIQAGVSTTGTPGNIFLQPGSAASGSGFVSLSPISTTDTVTLQFREPSGSGTNFVGFRAPNSIPSDVTWILPSTDATVANQALVSDAAGNLSWGGVANAASALELIDTDGDTLVTVEEGGPGNDDDTIIARIGNGPGGYDTAGFNVLYMATDEFNFYSPNAASGSGNDGVLIDILAGEGDGAGLGGDLILSAGVGGDTGDGGVLTVNGGPAGSTLGNGGDFDSFAGDAQNDGSGGNYLMRAGRGGTTNGQGGDIIGSAGDASATQRAGDINLISGSTTGTARGGNFLMAGGNSQGGNGGSMGFTAGTALAGNGNGGGMAFTAGSGFGTGNGGDLGFGAGIAPGTGTGGNINFVPGTAGLNAGGSIFLRGGESLGGNDGSIFIDPSSAAFTSPLIWRELVANGFDGVGFRAPAALTGTTIWTLPPTDGGPNDVLTTNGAGILTWNTLPTGNNDWGIINTAGGNNTGDTSISSNNPNDTLNLNGGTGIVLDGSQVGSAVTINFTSTGMITGNPIVGADSIVFFDFNNANAASTRTWNQVIGDLNLLTTGNITAGVGINAADLATGTVTFDNSGMGVDVIDPADSLVFFDASNGDDPDTTTVANFISTLGLAANLTGGIGITVTGSTINFDNTGMVGTNAVVGADTVPFFDASNGFEAEFRSWTDIITDLLILTDYVDEIRDANNDTYMRVEQGANDDTARIKVADAVGFNAAAEVLNASAAGGLTLTSASGTTGNAAPINIFSGSAGGAGAGGAISMTAGSGSGAGVGGQMSLAAGDGGVGGPGGILELFGGNGITAGGNIELTVGEGPNAANDGQIQIQPTGNDAVTMLFFDGTAANGVGLRAPSLMAAGTDVYVLPDQDGNLNDVLTTDGAGTMSWTSPNPTGLQDLNGDTRVEVERTANDDTVRMVATNVDIFTATLDQVEITTNSGLYDFRIQDTGFFTTGLVSGAGVRRLDGNLEFINGLIDSGTVTGGMAWLNGTTGESAGAFVDAARACLNYFDGGVRVTQVCVDPTEQIVMQVGGQFSMNVSETGGQLTTLLDNSSNTAGQTNQLGFRELSNNGSSAVGFKAPDAIAADVYWTLPATDGGDGEHLTTDGAGNLSWDRTSVYEAISGAAVQAIVTTPTTINFTLQRFANPDFSVAAGIVTCNRNGLYSVEYTVATQFTSGGGQRTEVISELYVNGLPYLGSRAYTYNRTGAGNNENASNKKVLVQLANGDQVEVRTNKTGASPNIDAIPNQSNILFERKGP